MNTKAKKNTKRKPGCRNLKDRLPPSPSNVRLSEWRSRPKKLEG